MSHCQKKKKNEGVYIRGSAKPVKLLKLKNSLYGLKQALRNFFLHYEVKFESVCLGSEPGIDPFLLVSDKLVWIVSIDDTIFFSPKEEHINELIEKLKTEYEIDLEVENSVAGFLGAHIDGQENGVIKFIQSGLAKQKIEAFKIDYNLRKFTPAAAVPLAKDENGKTGNGSYSYASVIGMLQYLQGHSKPDLTYVVSQCACFNHAPKRTHEATLERIGQYLKGTIDEGLILKPTDQFDVDVFVNADFAGLWPHEDKSDPMCVKRQAVCVITVAGCPIIWNSRLMLEFALSTMEAECNALSL